MAPDELASRIVRAMEARGYTVDKCAGEANIVYVEGMDPFGFANANRPDEYDDIRCVIRFMNGKPSLVGVWKATTQPGPKLTQNPVAGARDKGAAIIALGQQRCWTVDLHSGAYEALCQRAGTVVVFRDKNKNHLRDDETTTGWYGINQHHGGDSTKIGGHSAGCLVTPMVKDHEAFMRIVKSDPRYIANPGKSGFVFRTTVMPAAWVLQDYPIIKPKDVVGAGALVAGGGLWLWLYQHSVELAAGALLVAGIAAVVWMFKRMKDNG